MRVVLRMARSRHPSLAAALCVTVGSWTSIGIGQVLDRGGYRGSEAWVLVCDKRSCISDEQARSAFLADAYRQLPSFPDGTNPYGLTVADWAALAQVATARHEEFAAYRQDLATELCSQSMRIDTQAQLAAALAENIRRANESTEPYYETLYGRLSLVGRNAVDRKVDELVDSIHTVDLDHAVHFAAASIEPAEFFDVACTQSGVDDLATAPDSGTNESKRARPDTLPLVVSVSPECPVSMELVRESAEEAVLRENIDLVGWPALQEGSPFFGAYVGFECADEPRDSGTFGLRISLIETTDGSFVLWNAYVDESHWIGLGHPHVGLSHSDYSDFVRDAVDLNVSQFLREKFELE